MVAAYSMWEHEDAIGRPVATATHAFDWSTYCPLRDGSLAAWRLIPGGVGQSTTLIGFTARNLQHGRFGDVATIAVCLAVDERMLSWATLNVGQPRDRFNLAQAAHAALPPEMRGRYRRERLLADLDFFCIGLAEAWAEFHPVAELEPLAFESRSERRALASSEQWATLRSLRAQLGIRDSSDLPERLMATQALEMIRHLEGLLAERQAVGAGGG